ncbi:MAG: PrsW family glutamic-type intramembrane protease [Candidatus Portnoybacteria bacterium]|nr:PrsW family glutamic-type intramembrane protease [Candidatus Portnoybacteria bacterium]
MTDLASYAGYAALGILPSLIWLFFYLHKDAHPEPKKLVFNVFFWGVMAGPAAILLQLSARWLGNMTTDWPSFLKDLGYRDWRFFFNILLLAPVAEECLKYAVVRWKILKNPAFDEPLDAMLYLIISALGFAAIENSLNIFFLTDLRIETALTHTLARFLSATLLHALSSGILGYFLARSLFDSEKRKRLLFVGFLAAISIHSFYNLLAWLMETEKLFAGLAMAGLLAGLTVLVSWQFRRLKKQLTICKI